MAERLLLDASVWLAAYNADESDHLVCSELLVGAEFDFVALGLTLLEVTNVALRKWHNADDAHALASLIQTAVGGRIVDTLELAPVGDLIDLAATSDLTAYGAAYAAAAKHHGLRLVSLDQDLLGPELALHPQGLASR